MAMFSTDEYGRPKGLITTTFTEVALVGIYFYLKGHKFLGRPPNFLTDQFADSYDADLAERIHKTHAIDMSEMASLSSLPDLADVYASKPAKYVTMFEKKFDENGTRVSANLWFQYQPPNTLFGARLLKDISRYPGFKLGLSVREERAMQAKNVYALHSRDCVVYDVFREIKPSVFAPAFATPTASPIGSPLEFSSSKEMLAFFGNRSTWGIHTPESTARPGEQAKPILDV
jgi:hypothetical protein